MRGWTASGPTVDVCGRLAIRNRDGAQIRISLASYGSLHAADVQTSHCTRVNQIFYKFRCNYGYGIFARGVAQRVDADPREARRVTRRREHASANALWPP